MFTTFTGNSRRPRQVNLSGRSGNPFTATGSGGPRSAIDSAKEDRVKRQQERERIQASRRIQQTWRGYSSRRRTFSIWRTIWDEEEKDIAGDGSYASPDASLRQLNRLLLFFSTKNNSGDGNRLRWYGMRQNKTTEHFKCEGEQWTNGYRGVRRVCLRELRAAVKDTTAIEETLQVLAFAARRENIKSTIDAVDYYVTLADVASALKSTPIALEYALVAPLHSAHAYPGLAILLSHPLSKEMLHTLKDVVDTDLLGSKISSSIVSTYSARTKIWLLGNTIYLCGTRTIAVAKVIAQLLGTLSGDIEFEDVPLDMDNAVFDREVLSKVPYGFSLNTWLADQLSSLTDQASIMNLLSRATSQSSAQVFANLALTLLRCFPRKADDIRMWLYLGPTSSANSTPATQYFWSAMKQTSSFLTIARDSRAVIDTIRTSEEQMDDWTVILVFLELYTFLVKFMDDDQFLGRGAAARQTAIPVEDVAVLVTFLKNLGFALCFNVNELSEEYNSDSYGSSLTSPGKHNKYESKPRAIGGMIGVDVEYLKGLTTGLLRAIYDRDSRRHFLPADHWLMISRFDMSAFISSVVAEEEKRYLVLEEEDEYDAPHSSDDEDYPPLGQHSLQRQKDARQQARKKTMEKRRLESVAPRLEILQNMPFFIPFNTRVQIFREFVRRDKIRRRGGSEDADHWRNNVLFHSAEPGVNLLARHHAEIMRKQEFEDAYNQFYALGADFKEPIQITFKDEFGLQEAGIDGGGVTKEFLTSVITQAFDQANGGMDKYFIENEAHLLYPNPTALDDAKVFLGETFSDAKQIKPFLTEMLRKYEFLGRVIGKCMYEGILVDVSFAGFFLKKWALTGGFGGAAGESGYRASINDLREFDEALYRGLLDVKNAPDASEFGLTFTVDDMVGPSDNQQVVERELIANGSNVAVTNKNRLEYINWLSWYRLQGQSAPQTNAFLKGLALIIEPSWLSMFNQSELQTLVGGASSGIDVQDLRQNTQYGGTYVIGDDGQEHPSIKMFWKIMENLEDADRRKVLKFVTSTPRGPLLGFSNLNPRFSIRDSGSNENRFPTTSTCVNLLKLPMYRSEATMKKKLLDAVNSGAGFDLS